MATKEENMTRYALIDTKSANGWSGNGLGTVECYLPDNYHVVGETSHGILVAGEDDCGWTLDDYVLPRLSSGLIAGQEIDLTHPVFGEVTVEALTEALA